MNTSLHTQKNMPVMDTSSMGAGMVQQKYYTADEAMTFLEPRIRAMFC
ncbi:MAG: hypothetical protein MJZ65_04135 [Paludibacteraceae bacterium]|nr:hypothetical protein [Paludibacteraceae bacterium]